MPRSAASASSASKMSGFIGDAFLFSACVGLPGLGAGPQAKVVRARSISS